MIPCISFSILALGTLIGCAAFCCINPSEPFPAPHLTPKDLNVQKLFSGLDTSIQRVISNGDAPWRTNITSFAIEITSAENTVWQHYHTAPKMGNYSTSKSINVDGEKAFRIASISKVFTTLALLLLEQQDRLNFRDSITRYLPELAEKGNEGGVRWSEISLESLASQLSGIPREYGQSDLSDGLVRQSYGTEQDALSMGFPPLSNKDLPTCGANHETSKTCSRKDIIDGFKRRPPVFLPNFKSSYSNTAYILLGFVIENVTGKTYQGALEDLILNPLGMHRTTVQKPPDSEGVIPAIKSDWNYIAGAYEPTGGLYSTSLDLSIFLRSIINHELLSEANTNAWLKPRSWSSSLQMAYGMPWEIFRLTNLLEDTDRGMSLITKAGALFGYYLHIVLVPEYHLGLTILVAGEYEALKWLDNEVITKAIRGIEEIARSQTNEKYAGLYKAAHLESSLELEVHGGAGLVVKSWVSNGSDFLDEYIFLQTGKRGLGQGRVQLVPANIRRSNGGESWRATFVPATTKTESPIDGCLMNDVDSLMYGERGVQDVVFMSGRSGMITGIELPALRVALAKDSQHSQTRTSPSIWHRFQNFIGLSDGVKAREL